jgi:hypothetical protein
MKHQSSLEKFLANLLGLVDEYWAMRRPWQYGSEDPQCGLKCEGTANQRVIVMDPDVRQLIISQLIVIILPVGTLFAVWIWILSLRGGRH